MSEQTTNPEKGKNNLYSDILHRRYIFDSKDRETSIDLDTRSQIIALQNAQVNQSIDIKKVNSLIDNIQSMLGQLLNKLFKLATQERQPDFPIPSIEGSLDKRCRSSKISKPI